jgi:hypothetical protein
MTPFVATQVQAVSIEQYVERLLTLAKIEGSTLICALIYMDRFLEKTSSKLKNENFHRIFFVALVLSIKHNEDTHFNDKIFCKIGGLRLKQFRNLESVFLFTIKYRLFVKNEVYNTYFRYLNNIINPDEEQNLSRLY